MTLNNLSVTTFTSCLCNSDGEPITETAREHVLLYNSTVISLEEVDKAINDDSWKFDPRLIEISKKQLKYLIENQEEK